MSDIRKPTTFGGHETNAELRYVEVYQILADPTEEDNFPEPYQPVLVKELLFQDEVLASTGVIETDNANIEVYAEKSGKKHGTRGNGIGISFAVNGGQIDRVDGAFDEATDALTISVKDVHVTWAEVISEVATVLSGAFVLVSTNRDAEVGAAIAAASGTLSGGVDGGYIAVGDAFGIGDHDTKAGKSTGDKLWITWRKDANRWDIITGSPGAGGSTFRLARVVVAIPAATGNLTADWGEADAAASLLSDSTGEEEDPENPVDVVNRWDISFPVDAQIKIDVSKTPAQVDNGTCNPFVDWAAT